MLGIAVPSGLAWQTLAGLITHLNTAHLPTLAVALPALAALLLRRYWLGGALRRMGTIRGLRAAAGARCSAPPQLSAPESSRPRMFSPWYAESLADILDLEEADVVRLEDRYGRAGTSKP